MRKTFIAMLVALPLTALAVTPQTVVLDMQNMTLLALFHHRQKVA